MIVRAVSPYTEADPVSLLLHLLAAVGNIIGDRPCFRVGDTRHPLRLFVVLVGLTAKARKGLAWSVVRHLLSHVDRAWLKLRVIYGGLSSGEGVIYAVRDRLFQMLPLRRRGRVRGYQRVIVDHGVRDKRLFLMEQEFSQALRAMTREGSILSAIVRQAWDYGHLMPLTKHNPIKATRAHVSVAGHITQHELLRTLSQTDQANGFGNRFLWALVERKQYIPSPTPLPTATLHRLVRALREAVRFGRKVTELKRSSKAETYWAQIYQGLSEGKPGLLGALVGRGEAYVMRLACLYALLDCSPIVKLKHLKAGLALWRYCEASTLQIFSDRLGDPIADRILAALKAKGRLSETAIHALFGRHKSRREIQQALSLLEQYSLARRKRKGTRGRSRIVWSAA